MRFFSPLPCGPSPQAKQAMADSIQSSMGTLVGSPKLPFFLVIPAAAIMTGTLEAAWYCERAISFLPHAVLCLGVLCCALPCCAVPCCAVSCAAC